MSGPDIGAARAIGGVSRTGLVSMSVREPPSAVMSSRVRANPTLPRFGERRRKMPSKSTIRACPSLPHDPHPGGGASAKWTLVFREDHVQQSIQSCRSRRHPQTCRAALILARSMNQGMWLAQPVARDTVDTASGAVLQPRPAALADK
jgi:hypothetical protein